MGMGMTLQTSSRRRTASYAPRDHAPLLSYRASPTFVSLSRPSVYPPVALLHTAKPLEATDLPCP